MTCQHCQTWVGDEDHRCPRCGRRVRTTPGRISPATYPIAAEATARAYDFQPRPVAVPQTVRETHAQAEPVTAQQPLFHEPVNSPRVVAFESLTSEAERQSIRARAAEIQPVPTGKVELKRPRPRRGDVGQGALDFLHAADVAAAPEPSVICDARVAGVSARLHATLIDGLWILAGIATELLCFRAAGGQLVLQKHSAAFILMAVVTVPILYKLLWAYAGRDSFGVQHAGLRVVDFDGNPPARQRRYLRVFGSIISLLAAGVGLIWSFVDEDALAWQDHISGTFPTPADD